MTETEAVRRFNRTWSRSIGVLEESYLGQGRSLGASRLLFEIGHEGATLLELRRRLGLDSGYLSRLLRGLEEDHLVGVRPDPADQRRRVVVPTAKGHRAIDRLDRLSEDRAVALVQPLGSSQRGRLRDALGTAERLIRSATCSIRSVGVTSPDAVRAMRRYFAEIDERFDTGFDVGAVRKADIEGMTPPHGDFLVVRTDDEVIGCGGLQRHTRTIGEVKRMWVDPQWRGCGLGVRLLAQLEERASELGYREVYLDTNAALVEAIAMYERAGYRHIERYNDNPYAQAWFAKPVTRRPRPRTAARPDRAG